MSFKIEDNLAYAENPALSISSGPIVMDSSSLNEVTYQYVTNTASVAGPNSVQCYNGQDVMFDLRIPNTARVLLHKSYIRITGRAVYLDTTEKGLDPTKHSLPWNTIAALLDTAEIQMNQSSQLTEQINQNLGDGSMVKFLTRYSKEVLESMGDSLFTPTIETVRDTTTHMSSQSEARADALREVLGALAGTYRPSTVSKNIYLGDLFDSVRIPAAFFLQNLRITTRIKPAADIIFKTTAAAAHETYFYVTDIKLYLTMTNLTENQLTVERDKILKNIPILRESFYTYDAINKTYTAGASFRDSNVKNLQASVVLFPSTTTTGGGIGINRYQYCYNTADVGTGGITSFLQRYDSVYSPATPMVVDTTFAKNSELFAQYRLLCRKMSNRDTGLALNMPQAMGWNVPADAKASGYYGSYGQLEYIAKTDNNPYVLFCSQFFPLTAHGHKQMAGADHEVQLGGGTGGTAVVVRIRLAFLEIRGDTSVYVIN